MNTSSVPWGIREEMPRIHAISICGGGIAAVQWSGPWRSQSRRRLSKDSSIVSSTSSFAALIIWDIWKYINVSYTPWPDADHVLGNSTHVSVHPTSPTTHLWDMTIILRFDNQKEICDNYDLLNWRAKRPPPIRSSV